MTESPTTPIATPPSESEDAVTWEDVARSVIIIGSAIIVRSRANSETSNSSSAVSTRSSLSSYGRSSNNRFLSNVVCRKAFLLCYRLYTNPKELFKMWRALYDEHYLNDPEKEQEVKCNNILEFMHDWMSAYLSSDFTKMMRSDILNLVDRITNERNKMKFKLMIVRATKAHQTNRLSFSSISRPTPPSQPANSLLDISVSTAAKTFTMHEFEMFRTVLPKEFLDSNWQSQDKKYTLAPNITRIITRFNQVSYWVTTEIVVQKDQKTRRKFLQKFIKIAKCCEEMNNFNTMMEILSGLNNAAVHRLKGLWESLSDSVYNMFEEMEDLMQSQHNFKRYREEIKKREAPLLPYFGMYLRDLTFTSVGNEPYLEGGGINYEMIQMLWATVEEVQTWQAKSYKLPDDTASRFFLVDTPLHGFDDETLYELSLKIQLPSAPPSPSNSQADFRKSVDSVLEPKRLNPNRRATISLAESQINFEAKTMIRSKSEEKKFPSVTLSTMFGAANSSPPRELRRLDSSVNFMSYFDPDLSKLKMKAELKERELLQKQQRKKLRESRKSKDVANLPESPLTHSGEKVEDIEIVEL